MENDLTPDDRLPLLRGRPPLQTRGLRRVRLCAFLFRPVVILWRMYRQNAVETRVNALMDKVQNCRNREDLERLLGEPLYAVSGEVVDGPNRPDLIECYQTQDCCIDLWFKNDRLVDVSGFVKPTLWDIALTGGGPTITGSSDRTRP